MQQTSRTNVIGLDGHDGAGKTTLAHGLADRLKGSYVRPFMGSWGKELMDAYRGGDPMRTMQVGEAALRRAVSEADPARPIVLDRSWMTVGSLVPAATFGIHWSLRVPTVLCWCDIDITLSRLECRLDEAPESRAHHEYFLAVYRDLARAAGSPVLRTDASDIETTLEKLTIIAQPLLGEWT